MDMDWPALLVIFLIVLVLFGRKRLPGLGKSIGQSIRGFKSGLQGADQEKPVDPESDIQVTSPEAPHVTNASVPTSGGDTTAKPGAGATPVK
jgi:sec-independent protein translocase protein TatA